MDFPTFLVLATALSGAIWLGDWLLLFYRQRLSATGKEAAVVEAPIATESARKEPILVEYARSFFPVLFIVLIIRSFIAEPFRIPSGSMMPTLLAGDFILVNKFAYGLRLPVTDTKIVGIGAPKRGDVIVFRFPSNPKIDYIKRVIGLPGDHISYINKVVYVNGIVMTQQPIGVYNEPGAGMVMAGAMVHHETLVDKNHSILIRPESPIMNNEFDVPQGHYFVMGDNRDNSNDSRFWGYVPEANLVGKAFLIWMNWDSMKNGPFKISWERIGNQIN